MFNRKKKILFKKFLFGVKFVIPDKINVLYSGFSFKFSTSPLSQLSGSTSSTPFPYFYGEIQNLFFFFFLIIFIQFLFLWIQSKFSTFLMTGPDNDFPLHNPLRYLDLS